jgi:hypothetical protein
MIYFLKDTVTQEIKIGYSKKSPKQRLRDCQTGNAHKLILLGTVTGRREDEDCFHGRFAQHRLEGEWFKGDIIEEVLEILSAHQQNRLTIKRRTMSSETTVEPKENGTVPNNGTLDKDSGIEGISRIPGLKLKGLSVTLTENPLQQPRGYVECRAEIVYLLEFENDVTDEDALTQLRNALLGLNLRDATAKRLKHMFVDGDNVMIPFAPEFHDHHIVGGREAITGVAGDAIRILVGWQKALNQNYQGGAAKVKGVFIGENYIGEHPLKNAKKLLVSIR